MHKIVSAETWTVQPSGTADTRVFNSSKELFLTLKRQYKRASALNMSAVLHELLHKVTLQPILPLSVGVIASATSTSRVILLSVA